MPFIEQGYGLADRLGCFFMQCRGHTVAFVHHALADGGAKTAFLDSLENLFSVANRFHSQRASSSTLNQLSQAEPRRGPDRLGGMRRFHRPDAPFEPIDQR